MLTGVEWRDLSVEVPYDFSNIWIWFREISQECFHTGACSLTLYLQVGKTGMGTFFVILPCLSDRPQPFLVHDQFVCLILACLKGQVESPNCHPLELQARTVNGFLWTWEKTVREVQEKTVKQFSFFAILEQLCFKLRGGHTMEVKVKESIWQKFKQRECGCIKYVWYCVCTL